MKKNIVFFFILALLLVSNINAQVQNDTLVKFYTKEWIECTPDSAIYYEKLFKDGTLWHKKDFYVSNNLIQMDGYAEDKDFSRMVDTCKYYFELGGVKEEKIYIGYHIVYNFYYYENGVKKYAIIYDNNKRIIKEESWKKDGTQPLNYIAYRDASFKGGMEGWKNYLSHKLKADVPSKNGAKPGEYGVTISFVIDSNGKVMDIRAQNDPGYGIVDEAIRVIAKSDGNWLPQIEDNKPVRSNQTRIFKFSIQEE